jgi:hypothetical protein
MFFFLEKQVVGLEVVLLYITHHQNTQVNSLPMVDSHQQVMVEQAQCMSPQVQKYIIFFISENICNKCY